MAFKDDILKNDKLKDLAPEVVTELETVYRNNEQAAINEITSRNAKQIEDDVFALSGNPKQPGQKYYDYYKQEFNKLKESAGNSEELTTAKQTIATLQDQVKNGLSDEAAKQQIIDYKARVNQLETDLQNEKAGREKDSIGNYKREAKTNILSFTKGKTPAHGMTKDYMIELAETRVNSKLMELTPEIVNENGREIKQFRDKDNNVLLNPENGHKPYNESELAKKWLGDLVEAKREATGAGLNGDGKGKTIPLIAAKSQAELDELIHQQLTADGISKQDPDYYKKSKELREANNVSDLPLI